ncbi:DUF614 domain protein [Aspergillus saccharolyticus JOP 1030-1]|uniref:DUF614 domain protein n=1 Tax=Aspergillus saccharolyticus JOP 1030-1 TaxID=1450539 RepID=A0A318ZBC4_9EURO|nr:DUF614 domain protein [Aspergillus saccharolyticus JOP 1030-1]PYH43787.1 DUF614 domain protein [Aspergillus saccharolyticus JOP 1030-1]
MNRQLHLDTSNLDGGDQRYSFLATPLEMRAPGGVFRHTPVPASAPTHLAAEQGNVPEQVQPCSNEKAQHIKDGLNSYDLLSGPDIQQHPANYAPFADDIPRSEKAEAVVPDYAHACPPQSPGPLPIKVNTNSAEHTLSSHATAVAPDTNPLHSTSLPQFPPPVATTITATPTAHDILAYHQPGQIVHPNQVVKGGTWRTSLCGCTDIGSCCLGLICPCILYGRTQHRLHTMSRGEDPTNMLDHHVCNGSCTAMALFCGCQWFLASVQHRRVRKAYKIEGDLISDCVRATCCTCCTLIQDEVEIKKREEERGNLARASGAALVSPYMAPVQMSYGPPPR